MQMKSYLYWDNTAPNNITIRTYSWVRGVRAQSARIPFYHSLENHVSTSISFVRIYEWSHSLEVTHNNSHFVENTWVWRLLHSQFALEHRYCIHFNIETRRDFKRITRTGSKSYVWRLSCVEKGFRIAISASKTRCSERFETHAWNLDRSSMFISLVVVWSSSHTRFHATTCEWKIKTENHLKSIRICLGVDRTVVWGSVVEKNHECDKIENVVREWVSLSRFTEQDSSHLETLGHQVCWTRG